MRVSVATSKYRSTVIDASRPRYATTQRTSSRTYGALSSTPAGSFTGPSIAPRQIHSRTAWSIRRANRVLHTLLSATLLLIAVSVSAQEFDPAERAELRAFLESTIRGADSFADRYDAEVWLVDMSARLTPFVDDADARLALLETVHFYASQSDLPPELVLAVIDIESRFDRFAISRSGAQGLMQLIPETARDLNVHNPFDPDENIRGGSQYLRKMLDLFNEDLELALAAYNSGPTTVKRYGGIPPYDETREYVRRVKILYERYGQAL